MFPGIPPGTAGKRSSISAGEVKSQGSQEPAPLSSPRSGLPADPHPPEASALVDRKVGQLPAVDASAQAAATRAAVALFRETLRAVTEGAIPQDELQPVAGEAVRTLLAETPWPAAMAELLRDTVPVQWLEEGFRQVCRQPERVRLEDVDQVLRELVVRHVDDLPANEDLADLCRTYVLRVAKESFDTRYKPSAGMLLLARLAQGSADEGQRVALVLNILMRARRAMGEERLAQMAQSLCNGLGRLAMSDPAFDAVAGFLVSLSRSESSQAFNTVASCVLATALAMPLSASHEMAASELRERKVDALLAVMHDLPTLPLVDLVAALARDGITPDLPEQERFALMKRMVSKTAAWDAPRAHAMGLGLGLGLRLERMPSSERDACFGKLGLAGPDASDSPATRAVLAGLAAAATPLGLAHGTDLAEEHVLALFELRLRAQGGVDGRKRSSLVDLLAGCDLPASRKAELARVTAGSSRWPVDPGLFRRLRDMVLAPLGDTTPSAGPAMHWAAWREQVTAGALDVGVDSKGVDMPAKGWAQPGRAGDVACALQLYEEYEAAYARVAPEGALNVPKLLAFLEKEIDQVMRMDGIPLPVRHAITERLSLWGTHACGEGGDTK